MSRGKAGLIGLAAAALALAVGLGIWWTRRPRPDGPIRVSSAHFHDLTLSRPAGAPQGLVLLVSDRGGPGERERAMSEALVARGLMVLNLDLDTWRAGLDREPGCARPMPDVEDLSKNAQKALGSSSYVHPVLVGFGEGGAMIEALAGISLASTMAGGVAVAPRAALATARPLCDAPAPEADPSGGFRYPRPGHLQTPLIVLGAEPNPDGPAGKGPHVPEVRPVTDPAAQVTEAVNAAAALAAQDRPDGDLPVVDIPARGEPKAVALFISGDGGWRDIDKVMGDALAKDGVHVLGLDALRYFWTERDPKGLAADAAAILRKADPDRKLPVLLLGYSFGASMIPFAWPHLPQSLAERVRLIALMGPARTTGFSVTIQGWLGYGGEHAVLPAILNLPLERTICIYGGDDDAPACLDPSLDRLRRLRLPGGHHFDGDYPAVARRVLEAAGLPQ